MTADTRTSSPAGQLLSPKQVARALGVSESSLKRWCDKGLIPTERTAGGHRRLPLAGVLDFLVRSDAVQVVEWPEFVADWLPTPRFIVRFEPGTSTGAGEDERLVEIIENVK